MGNRRVFFNPDYNLIIIHGCDELHIFLGKGELNMCGRYYIEIDDAELSDICDEVQKNAEMEQLSIESIKTGEIFPTNIVPIQVGDHDYRAMRWGFDRFDGKGQIINAKSETALSKPLFAKSMRNYRCIVPASKYFEWQKLDNKKIKHEFYLPEKILYIAGCYRLEAGSAVPSFVILTRAASDSISVIHDRMPVILPKSRVHEWLYESPECMDDPLTDLQYRPAV